MKMKRLAALAAAGATLATGMAWGEIVLYGREGFDMFSHAAADVK